MFTAWYRLIHYIQQITFHFSKVEIGWQDNLLFVFPVLENMHYRHVAKQ